MKASDVQGAGFRVLGNCPQPRTPNPERVSSGAADRILATRLGVCAADAAHEGQWGTAAALRGSRVETVPLADMTAPNPLDPELLRVAEVFFAG